MPVNPKKKKKVKATEYAIRSVPDHDAEEYANGMFEDGYEVLETHKAAGRFWFVFRKIPQE